MATQSGTDEPLGRGDAVPMRGIDPHVEWLADTKFQYVPLQTDQMAWLPILIELREKKTAAQFAAYAWHPADDIDAAKKWIRIPAMYVTPPARLRENRYCTAIVTPEFFSQLEEHAGLKAFIERIEIGASYLAPLKSSPPVVGDLLITTPKHVVGGIIDDGCAFALDRFQRSDGSTRVAFFWDQDGPGGVPDVGYGRETSAAEINLKAKKSHDESELYRDLKFLDFGETGFKALGRRVSHGTAATDLAYGLPRTSVSPSKLMPIIGVKLPNRVSENPADFELDPWAIDALYYILLRADSIARDEACGPLPVVVNMSYGLVHGPHDGTRILERAIDQWIKLREAEPNPLALTVVLPTGNWYLDRLHAHMDVPGNGVAQRLTLRVPPGNLASNWTYLYIRRLPGDPPVVSVQVTDPGGRSTTWVTRGTKDGLVIDGVLVCELLYRATLEPDYRDEIALWIGPTAALDVATLARSGSWKIDVRNTGDACVVEGWVRRGEAPAGHPPFGHQARFDDATYEKYDYKSGRLIEVDNASYIKRYGTISGIATGDKSVVVGGARRYVQHDRPRKYLATLYSGAGPVVGLRTGPDPDVTALSEEGQTLHGVLTRGTCSGSTVAVNGTSVAAPKVANLAWRLLRTNLVTGTPLGADRPDIRARAKLTPGIPKERGGDGAIVVPPVAPPGKIRR